MQEQNTHLCKSDVLTNFAGILVLGHLVHQALSLHIVVRERKDPPAPLVVGIVQEPVKWVNDDRSTTVDQTQLTTSIPRTFNPPLTPMVRHQSVLSRVTCVEDNLVRPSAQTRRQASRFQPKVSRLLRSLKDEPK